MEDKNIIVKPSINYLLVINTILIMNIIDLVLTVIGLELGYFIEANKYMLWVYEKSPVALILIKLFLMLFFYFVCKAYINKVRNFIKHLLLIPLPVYSIIFILHIITLVRLF